MPEYGSTRRRRYGQKMQTIRGISLDLSPLTRPGARQGVIAGNGVVTTSQPLAAQVGLDILRRGGNAVDAAIATAATLAVVEPSSNGIGGDAFALVWDGDRLHGLNGSGRAPAALSAGQLREWGHTAVPHRGWLPVTIPGAPAAWRDLHDTFGCLDFSDLMEPAASYAESGFPVSPVVAWGWTAQVEQHDRNRGPEFTGFLPNFTRTGQAPAVGDLWRNPDMANTLRSIGSTGAADFYHGDIAAKTVAFAEQTGGFITAADLAEHTSTWVDPISTAYRGFDVWEIPPNGQGIAALIALNILEGFDLAAVEQHSAQALHWQLEAMKLGFADAQTFVADPTHSAVPTLDLLSKDYAARRRSMIGPQAIEPAAGDPESGGTVLLATADRDGMMVSFIQSNFEGFGSHVVVPGTGVALQNRGAGFSLEPGHRNELAPGKRPFHTIIPGFMTRDGQAIGPFGVMGGHMQPQGHLQTIVSTVDYHRDPQTALGLPRFRWNRGRGVLFEAGLPDSTIADLMARGHQIQIIDDTAQFGRGQIIWRLPSGSYVAGSDHRADGHPAAY